MITITRALELIGKLTSSVKELELKQVILELQTSLTSSLDSYYEMIDKNAELRQENEDLKNQIKRHTDWDKEKQEYQKFNNLGCVFYVRKDSYDRGSSHHLPDELFCPHCFEVRCAAYHLQTSVKHNSHRYCPACKNEFRGPVKTQFG